MWSRFFPVFKYLQKGFPLWFTLALLSPIFPFGFWLILQNQQATLEKPDLKQIKEPINAIKSQPYPRLAEDWFFLKSKTIAQYLKDFEGQLVFLGMNSRPDRQKEEALLTFKGSSSPFRVEIGVPFYIGSLQNGQTDVCWGPVSTEDLATFVAKLQDGTLELALLNDKDTKYQLIPVRAKAQPDTQEWRGAKEQVLRYKYLGVDQVKEFFNPSKNEPPIRLFDEIHQKILVLTEKSLLKLGSCVCRINHVKEHQIEVSLWDKGGFFSETVTLPLLKGEKIGSFVQPLFQGVKLFGHNAIWLKKTMKGAFYVGDWLLEEQGIFKRPDLKQLDDAIAGKLKGALAYFQSLKKEKGKWVAEIVVFDNLHIQKETLRITLESKTVLMNPQSKISEKREVPLAPPNSSPRHSTMPKPVEPLFDEFNDEDDLEGYP